MKLIKKWKKSVRADQKVTNKNRKRKGYYRNEKNRQGRKEQ